MSSAFSIEALSPIEVAQSGGARGSRIRLDSAS